MSSSRLVTMIGVGGVGKTRLAVQIAADVLPAFSDGAWLCELAAASDEEAAFQLVAAALGVQQRPGVSLPVSIREFLRVKQMLVVLDNCEHLLDAAGRLAEDVLRDCPDVRILATSREALAVEGEQIWPLRSLGIPDDAHDLAAVSTSDAVQLFVDRAHAARPDFTINEGNAGAVVEICRRLDGVPLAIELAAARVSAMSPPEIAELLDERFRLLTGGRRTAVERHQALRATVDWSYSLLDERDRIVFDRLGVFVGGFDPAAARAVVIGDGIEVWDVLDALASLVGKSMLVADDGADGTTRYMMLETLRQYAREQLDESGDADAWRRRHADYYTHAGRGDRARAPHRRRSRGDRAGRPQPRQSPCRGAVVARLGRARRRAPRARHHRVAGQSDHLESCPRHRDVGAARGAARRRRAAGPALRRPRDRRVSKRSRAAPSMMPSSSHATRCATESRPTAPNRSSLRSR